MKNQLIVLFCILIHAIAAGQDQQWFIANGNGKNGVNASGINQFTVTNPGTKFAVKGVSLPNLGSELRAKNDLFVIFSNGLHLNTRYQEGGIPGLSEGVTYSGTTEHIFKSLHGAVNYMYLTNKYEGDDPPRNVSISTSLNQSATVYDLDTTRSKLMEANHDVVPNKDLTVIINYDSLRLPQFNAGNDHKFILRYDGIYSHQTETYSSVRVVELSNAFNGAQPFVYSPDGVSSPGVGRVEIYPNSNRYNYISFRPNSMALNFPPDSEGNPTHDAVFTLLNGGVEIRKLHEGIRHSHDPNFLKVDSICMAEDEYYVVFFTLQFENTSSTPVDSVEATIKFNERYLLSCFSITEWNMGGASCNGDVEINGDEVHFTFTEHDDLVHCTPANPNCTGSVQFRVKHKAGFDLQDTEEDIRPGTTTVYFDNAPFVIDQFIDPWIPKPLQRVVRMNNCAYCETGTIDPRVLAGVVTLFLGAFVLFRRWRKGRKMKEMK